MYTQDNTGRNAFHLAVSTGNQRSIEHFLAHADTENHIVHIPDRYVDHCLIEFDDILVF
jgi:hypothetical protein